MTADWDNVRLLSSQAEAETLQAHGTVFIFISVLNVSSMSAHGKRLLLFFLAEGIAA